MTTANSPTPDPRSSVPAHSSTEKHIRGSSLLLAGRTLSLGLNFATQILIVRYLSKSDYGAFAFALCLVSLASSVVVFGLDKASTRFVSIYLEKRDYSLMFGTIFLMAATVLGLGVALVAIVFGFHGFLTRTVVQDSLATELLLIMILLAPIQALDSLLLGMFAIFAGPRAILFRKHILGPGLKLGVVLLLILAGRDAYFLSAGYLLAGFVGIVIYSSMLIRVFMEGDLLEHLRLNRLKFPVRELFRFSVPLLSSDLVFLLRGTLVVLLLEYFQGSVAVAEFRSVLPVARLNQVVFGTFHVLFTPLASRMYARGDRAGINDLYWRTAIWITILSFPVFILSFALAEPVTSLLFGRRYADSSVILAILSLGFYFHAALGFNSLALRIFGRVRYIFTVDVLAALLAMVLSLVLIPRYGAVGGAIGISVTLVAQNMLNQAGLLLGTGIKPIQRASLRLYLTLMTAALGMLLIQVIVSPPLCVGIVVAAGICILTLRLNCHLLDVAKMFPEAMRFGIVRRLLGASVRTC